MAWLRGLGHARPHLSGWSATPYDGDSRVSIQHAQKLLAQQTFDSPEIPRLRLDATQPVRIVLELVGDHMHHIHLVL